MSADMSAACRYEGMTAAWKKAVVTLDKDSKTIDFFDGLL